MELFLQRAQPTRTRGAARERQAVRFCCCDILAGSSDYTGATAIFNGTLALSGTGSLGTSALVAINDSASFDISKTTSGATVDSLQTIGGSPSNPSTATVYLGNQTLTVTTNDTSGQNTFNGIVADGGLSGKTGGSLVMAGTGVLSLAGVNTYTGSTTIESGGTLALAAQYPNCNGGSCVPVANGSIAASSGLIINGAGTFDISQLQNLKDSTKPASTNVAAIDDDGAGNGTIFLGSNRLIVGDSRNLNSSFSGTISDCGAGTQCLAARNCNLCTPPSGGSLIKDGAGTLLLSGPNTFSGGTILSGGALQVGVDIVGSPGAITSSAIGTGTLTFDGGTLQAGAGHNYTIANAAQITTNGATVDSNGTNFTYSGALGDSGTGVQGNLAITDSVGGGRVTLTNTNTYTGTTTINGGTLALSGPNGSIASSSGVAIASGATFDITHSSASLPFAGFTLTGTTINTLSGAGNINLGANALLINQKADETFSGVISGNPGPVGDSNSPNYIAAGISLGKTGSGTLTLTGVNAFIGFAGVFDGVLALKGGGDLSSAGGVAVGPGATFDISQLTNGTTTLKAIRDAGNTGGIIDLGSKNLTIDGTIGNGTGSKFSGVIQDGGIAGGAGGSLTLTGGWTLQLSNKEGYTGVTTINSGTLILGVNCGNNCSDPSSIVSTGDISKSSGVVINPGGAFDISLLTANVGGTFGPATTTVQSLQGTAGSNVYLGSNTLDVNLQTGTTTFGAVISDCGTQGQCATVQTCLTNGGGPSCHAPSGGALIKDGAGTLILSGNNTYTGATTVNNGVLSVTGSLSPSSAVQINSGGTLAGIRTWI